VETATFPPTADANAPTLRRARGGGGRNRYHPPAQVPPSVGRQPSPPPAQAPAWSWTASSPQLADANAPSPASLRGCAGAAPAPFTPARSSSVVGAAVGRPRVRLSSQPPCGWRVPPADRLRASCSPNCSRPRKLQLRRGRQPSSNKAGWDAPETAAASVLRSSVNAHPIPVHPPSSISPALGPRNVPWHSGPFPRPPARELPAPGSGGIGATRPPQGGVR